MQKTCEGTLKGIRSFSVTLNQGSSLLLLLEGQYSKYLHRSTIAPPPDTVINHMDQSVHTVCIFSSLYSFVWCWPLHFEQFVLSFEVVCKQRGCELGVMCRGHVCRCIQFSITLLLVSGQVFLCNVLWYWECVKLFSLIWLSCFP